MEINKFNDELMSNIHLINHTTAANVLNYGFNTGQNNNDFGSPPIPNESVKCAKILYKSTHNYLLIIIT